MISRIKSSEFRLLPHTNEIEISGRSVKLTPKEMGVLEILIEREDLTVSRQEILAIVWGDKYANDQGLTQAISKLRKILNSCPSITIRTIPKRGYLFQRKKLKSIKSMSYQFPLNAKNLVMMVLILVICALVFLRRIEIRIDKTKPEIHEIERLSFN